MKSVKKKREVRNSSVEAYQEKKTSPMHDVISKKTFSHAMHGVAVGKQEPIQEIVGRVRPSSDEMLSWRAPEYEFYHKTLSWYWMSFVFAGVLVLVALWQQNFLFAVFVIIAWLTLSSLASRVPAIWQFTVHDNGLTIGPLFYEQASLSPRETALGKEVLYAWKDIRGFDIHHQAFSEYRELVLRLNARFSPYVKIPFPVTHETLIISRLLQFIPKEEYTDSLADALSRFVRF